MWESALVRDYFWTGVALMVAGSVGSNAGNNLVSLSLRPEAVRGNVDAEGVSPTSLGDEVGEASEGIPVDMDAGDVSRSPPSHPLVPTTQLLQVTAARTIEESVMTAHRMLSNHSDDGPEFVYEGGVVGSTEVMQAMRRRFTKRFGKSALPPPAPPPTLSDSEGGTSPALIATLREAFDVEQGRQRDVESDAEPEDTQELSQRLSQAQRSEETFALDHEELCKRTPSQKALWTAGALVFVAGSLLVFVALGLGPQSLLAALESTQYLCSTAFGALQHRQPPTLRASAACACIMAGCAMAVVFSPHLTTVYSAQGINAIYMTNTGYQIYAGLALLLCVTLTGVFHLYHRSRTVLQAALWGHAVVEPLSFALSSALIGSQAVLMAKTLSMLLQVSVTHDSQFSQPTIYLVFLAFLLFVGFWLMRLNAALELFQPTLIVPLMEGSYTLLAIVSGGVFFGEFKDMGVELGGFAAGVLLILAGVCLLPVPLDEDTACATM